MPINEMIYSHSAVHVRISASLKCVCVCGGGIMDFLGHKCVRGGFPNLVTAGLPRVRHTVSQGNLRSVRLRATCGRVCEGEEEAGEGGEGRRGRSQPGSAAASLSLSHSPCEFHQWLYPCLLPPSIVQLKPRPLQSGGAQNGANQIMCRH